MAEKLIRIGKVSSINYKKGLIRVTYSDRDDSVTAEFPVFSFTDEYKMPKIGSQVLVLHLSNGASAGVVLGHYWNEKNVSPATGKEVFRKELGLDYGEAFFEYKNGTLKIHADKIVLDGPVVAQDSVKATGDVTSGGISLSRHTHTGVHGETSGPN